jgi:NADH:ubiquinone oxidoreductase subunit K
MRNTGRVSQLAAWVILVLLVLVPCAVSLTAPKANVAWLVWTVVSLYVVLNAVELTTLAFPESHSPKRAMAIILLAVANILISLALALLPAAWFSASR